MNKGKLIVISGPSGVGKGTICKVLIDKLKAEFSVSSTTRSPREGEIDGIHYNFISKEDFVDRINRGLFLEYNLYNNNYYGTDKDFVNDKINKGIDIILEIDVNGGFNVKKSYNDALLIYIAPPSIEELRNRLINRGTESIEKINQRLEIAKNEMEVANKYDYVVVNDDLDKAINEVYTIIKGDK